MKTHTCGGCYMHESDFVERLTKLLKKRQIEITLEEK